MPNPDDLMKRLNNVLDGPDAGLGLHSILAECRDRIVSQSEDSDLIDFMADNPHYLVWDNGSYCGVTDQRYDNDPTNPSRHKALRCKSIREALRTARASENLAGEEQ